EKTERPDSKNKGRPQRIHRIHPQSALRLQDHFLCPGIYADARGRSRIQMEPELWRDCVDVARRLYYPQRVPGRNQEGVRAQLEAHQSAARLVFSESDQGQSTRV